MTKSDVTGTQRTLSANNEAILVYYFKNLSSSWQSRHKRNAVYGVFVNVLISNRWLYIHCCKQLVYECILRGWGGGRLEFKLLQGARHSEFYVCTFIKVISVFLFSPRLVGSKPFITPQCVGEVQIMREAIFGGQENLRALKNFRWSVKPFSPSQEEDNPVLYPRPCCSLQDAGDAGVFRIKENTVAGWAKQFAPLPQS